MTTQENKSVRLLSIEQAQECFSVSRMTINRLIKGKHLQTIRVGRAVRIPESSVLEFISNGGNRHIEGGAA